MTSGILVVGIQGIGRECRLDIADIPRRARRETCGFRRDAAEGEFENVVSSHSCCVGLTLVASVAMCSIYALIFLRDVLHSSKTSLSGNSKQECLLCDFLIP